MPKLLKYAAIILGALTLAGLFALAHSVAGLAAAIVPGSFLWVYGGALALEGLASLWFIRGVFWRQQHLSFTATTPEERQRLMRELTARLRENPHVRDIAPAASLDPADPAYAEACLAVLRRKSDEEIRNTAERIFLATALAQNGRIDAIIVFASLCRLVWRISGIYNQRPHPGEILALYWAVITTTFIAFSFEELDLSTEITIGFGKAFHAMAPATMTGGIPFMGAALQKFTSSAIDGAANGFLALRAGIITRNAYMYMLEGREQPSRASVYTEASGILLGMSGRLIEQITKSIGGSLWGLTKAAQNKTAQAGQSLADGAMRAGSGLGHGVGKFASGTVDAVQATGDVLKHTGQSVASGVAGAAVGTGRVVTSVVAKTGRTVAAPFRRSKK